MSNQFNFQDVILRLHQFWSARNCTILSPYSEKVGAGTLNLSTAVRVLGPEPWSVAYVEPSFRPDDGRYGENPNRVQMHHQYQVVMKPDPSNPQELYLESLKAIGIDIKKHDIRFVEDNWESPALGAWGLGWEVWLDGLEITQYTYFQQVASQSMSLPAVEITYGLERLVMYLQGVSSIWDIQWDNERTYRDVFLQQEIDYCKYNFETADIASLKKMYELYAKEADACIQNNQITPAHDYVLKCSHAFNLLDARGAIGVTERADFFKQMRRLAKQVGEKYVAHRKEMGHPLLKGMRKLSPTLPALGPALSSPRDFLLELGTEELPPHALKELYEHAKIGFKQLLKEHGIGHGDIEVYSTPRRLAILVRQVAHKQEDRQLTLKGPRHSQAFDAAGNLTAAGEGFLKSTGATQKDLIIKPNDKGEKTVFVDKLEPGKETGVVLSQTILPKFLASIKFKEPMRWDETGVAFSRPLRWIVALQGDRIIPVQFGNVVSDRVTRAARSLDSTEIELTAAEEYLAAMAWAGVEIDREKRLSAIINDTAQIARSKLWGTIDPKDPVIEEIADLVEKPNIVLCGFDERFLKLPKEVLVSVMKKHQRYIPIYDAHGNLLPHFFAVANGDQIDPETVKRGYENVLIARYSDAEYFINNDQKHKLEDFDDRLKTLVFQEKLGSMYDKQKRVIGVLEALTKVLPPENAEALTEAARVCKNDLVSSMVTEMTALQGTMGRHYALQQGKPEVVADILYEYLLPRHSTDRTPESRDAAILGIADRVDSLVGLFASGAKPSGTTDPYALRRTAIGLIQTVLAHKLDFDLEEILIEAGKQLPSTVAATPAVVQEVRGYVTDKLQGIIESRGISHDIAEATIAANSGNILRANQRAEELRTEINTPEAVKALTAFMRCAKIVKDPQTYESPAQEELDDTYSKDLYAQTAKAREMITPDSSVKEFLATIGRLGPKIDQFFENVMIMVEDQKKRKARLGLMADVVRLSHGIADFSKLQIDKPTL